MPGLKTIDFWSGLGFAILGGAACILALDFDRSSSTYPATLAAVLVVLSLALVVETLRDAKAKTGDAEGARIILWGPGVEIGCWCLWSLALWAGLGYIGPGFLAIGFLILRHSPVRRVRRHLFEAGGVILGVFAIFYLIFQVPLPELEFIRDLLE